MVEVSESMLIASITSWFTPTVLFCVTNLIIATLFIASNNNNNNKQNNDHTHSDSSSRITRVSSLLGRTKSFNLSSYTTTSATLEAQHNYQSQSKPPSYSSSSRLVQSIHVPQQVITPHELINTKLEPQQPSQLVRTPLLERVKSINFSSIYTEPEHNTSSPSQLTRVPSFFDRVKSFKFTQHVNVDTNSGQYSDDHHVVRSKSEKTKVKKKSSVSEMKKSRSEMRMADDDDSEDDYSRRPATTRERGSLVDEEVDAKADDFISRFKQQLKLQRLESLVRYNEMMNRRS